MTVQPTSGATSATSVTSDLITATAQNIEDTNFQIEQTQEMTTMSDITGMTSAQLLERINDLKADKAALEQKLAEYEAEAKTLSAKAASEIASAQRLEANALSQYQDKADSVVQSCIEAFNSANKKEYGSMTKDQLASNIKDQLNGTSPDLARAMLEYTRANDTLDALDGVLFNISSTQDDISFLDTEIIRIEGRYNTVLKEEQEAAAAAAAAKSKSSDPVGFMHSGARYDFIVNDGNFDTISDFLGSDEKGWQSVVALDTDGDGIISAKEMQENNIMMVKTLYDANGNKTGQEVVDVVKEFGEDFSLDLNSYKSAANGAISHDAVDENIDADGNGVIDQKLVGTFNVNVAGESVKGYQTLDDRNWLSSEYNVADDISKQGAAASGTTETQTQTLNFFVEYSKISQEQADKVARGISSVKATEATMQQIDRISADQAKLKANDIMRKLEPEDEADNENRDDVEEKEAQEKLEEEAKQEEQEKLQEELEKEKEEEEK